MTPRGHLRPQVIPIKESPFTMPSTMAFIATLAFAIGPIVGHALAHTNTAPQPIITLPAVHPSDVGGGSPTH